MWNANNPENLSGYETNTRDKRARNHVTKRARLFKSRLVLRLVGRVEHSEARPFPDDFPHFVSWVFYTFRNGGRENTGPTSLHFENRPGEDPGEEIVENRSTFDYIQTSITLCFEILFFRDRSSEREPRELRYFNASSFIVFYNSSSSLFTYICFCCSKILSINRVVKSPKKKRKLNFIRKKWLVAEEHWVASELATSTVKLLKKRI